MPANRITKAQLAEENTSLKNENDTLREQLESLKRNADFHPDATLRVHGIAANNNDSYFNIIINSVSAAIFVNEPATGVILDVNRPMCQMFGYSYDEALKASIGELSAGFLPYTQADALSWLQKAKDFGSQSFEWLAKHKSGNLFWVEVNINHVLIDEQERFVVTVNDISSRKEVEKELQESGNNYMGLFNIITEAIYVLDRNNIFIDVNHGAELMYGYPKERLIGMTPEFVSAPGKNDLSAVTGYLEDAWHGKIQQFEFWGLRADGSIFPKDVRVQKGRYFGKDVLIASAFDISERKQFELSICESEEKFRLLLDESSDPIFSFEPDGTYKYVNRAFAAPFKKQPSEIIGKRIFDIFPKEEADKRFAVMRWVFENGVTKVFEVRVPLPTGDRFYLTSVKPIKNPDNEVISVICSSKEITDLKKIEKDLRESREQFIQFMDHLPGLAFIKDSERHYLYINDKLQVDFKCQAADLIGKKHEEIWPGEDAERIKKADIDVLRSGQAFTEEEKTLSPLGNRVYLTTRFKIPVSETESMLGGITIDVTERRRWDNLSSARLKLLQYAASHSVADVLKKTVEELKELIESKLVALFVLSEDQNFVVNLICAGVESPSLSGSNLLPVDNFDKTKSWNMCLTRRTPVINNSEVFANECGVESPSKIVKNQMFIPVLRESRIMAVLSLADKPTDFDNLDIELAQLLMDSVWDIVKRKQALAELQISERRYRKIIENIQDIYYRTDINGNVVIISNSALRLLGIPDMAGVIGRPISGWWLVPEERQKMLDKIAEEGAVIDYEVSLRRTNGEKVTVAVSSAFYTDENGLVQGVEGVFRDITFRKLYELQLIKAKEEAEQMNRAKSSFLANMSHELRTPLIGIIGYSDILREMLTDKKQKQMMETIFNSGGRLLETLNLILNLAKIEANQEEIQWQPASVNQLIQQSVKLFKAAAANKNLTLSANLSAEELFVNIDIRLLVSAINNLINNAIKFTDNGYVNVESKKLIEDDIEYVLIQVMDTGIGISEEDKNIIFEEFRQASEGYGRAFEGSGLGLAIVKRSVELLNGHIYVESRPGQGSVFSIKLPLFKHEILPEEKISPVKSMVIKPEAIPNILLIDDDETTRGVVENMLENYAAIDYASNGFLGLDLMQAKRYSVILLDINLGRGINGLGVLKQLRQIPGYSKVPVIAITAYAMEGDRERFLSAGCDQYLSKPFHKDELIAQVKTAINTI